MSSVDFRNTETETSVLRQRQWAVAGSGTPSRNEISRLISSSDTFSRLAEPQKLLRCVPDKLGRVSHFEMVEAVYRQGVFSVQPQYRWLARPLYRLAGGDAQPFSSTLLAVCVTDYLMHQLLGPSAWILGRDMVRQGLGPAISASLGALWRIPEPGNLTVSYLSVGLPVALRKLGGSRIRNNLNALADVIFPGKPALARKLVHHVLAVMQSDPQRAHAWALSSNGNYVKAVKAMQHFVAGNVQHADRYAQLWWFASFMAPDESAGDLRELYLAVQSYVRTGQADCFSELAECLDQIVAVDSEMLKTKTSARAIQTDLAKGVLLGLAIGVLWAAYLSGVVDGEHHGRISLTTFQGGVSYHLATHLLAVAVQYYFL